MKGLRATCGRLAESTELSAVVRRKRFWGFRGKAPDETVGRERREEGVKGLRATCGRL